MNELWRTDKSERLCWFWVKFGAMILLLKIGNLAETLRRNYVGKVSHGGCVCAGAAWEKLCGGEHTGWQGKWGGRRRRVCVCVCVLSGGHLNMCAC